MSTTSAPGFTVRVILSLAALGLVIGVIAMSVRNHQPEPVDSDVARQRLANKADYLKINGDILSTYGVVDKDKGIFRIPLSEARAKALVEIKSAQRKD